MSRIGIIGDGNVGSTLARGLARAGHEVRAVGRDRAAVRDAAGWSEVAVLAMPFGAIDDAFFNIQLGYVLGMGTRIGFQLLRG